MITASGSVSYPAQHLDCLGVPARAITFQRVWRRGHGHGGQDGCSNPPWNPPGPWGHDSAPVLTPHVSTRGSALRWCSRRAAQRTSDAHQVDLPITGLQPAQFRKLVRLAAERRGDAISDGGPGRQQALDLPDRVLLVAAY